MLFALFVSIRWTEAFSFIINNTGKMQITFTPPSTEFQIYPFLS